MLFCFVVGVIVVVCLLFSLGGGGALTVRCFCFVCLLVCLFVCLFVCSTFVHYDCKPSERRSGEHKNHGLFREHRYHLELNLTVLGELAVCQW